MPADVRLSPQLMAGILEGLRDAVVIVDDSTRTILLCNSAATAIFGYPPDQMIGMSITRLHVDPAARETFRRALDRAVGQAGFLSVPSFTMKRADGQTFDAEITVAPIEDDRRIGWVGVFRDVSEQRRAEAALRASETRYRTLFYAVSDALFVYTLDERGTPGRFLEVNDVACDYLGYGRAELLRLSTLDLATPEMVAARPAALEQLRQSSQVVWETALRAKDGRIIPVEFSEHLFEVGGQPTVVSAVRDIRDRKAAEEALRQSEARYRSLIHNASYGIGRTSVDGRFLVVNPALARMLGYASEEELLAVRVPDVYPDAWARHGVLERIDREGETEFVTEFVRKDGSLMNARLSARAIRAADGRLAAIELFAEDVTGRETVDHQHREPEGGVPAAERVERALGLEADVRHALAAVRAQLDGTGHAGGKSLKILSDAVASLPASACVPAEREAVMYAASQLTLYLRASALGASPTLAPEFHGPEAARACVDALDLRVSRLVEALRR
jgi:PAS domain S-box-containing protein